jgi:hypothetical protein
MSEFSQVARHTMRTRAHMHSHQTACNRGDIRVVPVSHSSKAPTVATGGRDALYVCLHVLAPRCLVRPGGRR